MTRAAWLTGVILVLVVPACGTVAGTGTTTGHRSLAAWSGRLAAAEPGKPVPTAAVSRLTALADQADKENGGHPVAWATAVVTTWAKALASATPGDYIPNDAHTVVYLVTMKGAFTDDGFSGPPGSRAPTGDYVSLVIRARTFEATDFGISDRPPPVAPVSLGTVTYLRVETGR
jgi:hypothetical protein